jgi:hypothetical protein
MIFIVKPGENSNRGTGITVTSNLDQIREIVAKQTSKRGKPRSYII